ncbi:uncharacterized protein N7479_004210 [Penicillium vulpinum]|uniref:uncharacterized protein n=1 Tax=Penicillium vulpinum TaxID=29845 RepID=UPI002547D4A4|nr:uncharacterized protein N7479_004210 [Penicillium vulpinum]KAJ5964334.1 hypothetical protein N7479_004210 [Penicillium vulpinum]
MAPTRKKPQAKVKVNPKAKVLKRTEIPKLRGVKFLILDDDIKMDYKLTAQNLGIQKSAYRIRLLRLQQRYGIKKVGPTGSPHNTTQSTADDTEMSDLADLEDTNTEGATEKYDA